MKNGAARLTERQQRFADLYLKLGNASEAAEQAGYKRSYAQGAKRQPAVQEYMRDRLEEMRRKNVASADEVLEFLTRVMRGEVAGERPEKNSSPRMKAAELLGRRLGVFTDVGSVLNGPEPSLAELMDDILGPGAA